MNSTAGSPPSTPPTPPPAAGGGEEGRIQSIDQRFAAVNQELADQRGILGRIEAALTGGRGGGQPAAGGEPAGPSIREQVIAGVREIQAEQQRQQAADAQGAQDQQWRASVDRQLAEARPAEGPTGPRARIARWIAGAP